MKMLASKRMQMSELKESRGPPRNRYWPQGDIRAQREKQLKIRVVDKKAVEMIAGLMPMTISNKGPSPSPFKTEKEFF